MFMAMKREVLRLGGYQREFAVSQTPELTAMADVVIDLELRGVGAKARGQWMKAGAQQDWREQPLSRIKRSVERHGRCIDRASTRSRISFPALKCGTYFGATETVSPTLRITPGTCRTEVQVKTPKPRISTRSPLTSACPMASRISFTAMSASLTIKLGKREARAAMRSERHGGFYLLDYGER